MTGYRSLPRCRAPPASSQACPAGRSRGHRGGGIDLNFVRVADHSPKAHHPDPFWAFSTTDQRAKHADGEDQPSAQTVVILSTLPGVRGTADAAT